MRSRKAVVAALSEPVKPACGAVPLMKFDFASCACEGEQAEGARTSAESATTETRERERLDGRDLERRDSFIVEPGNAPPGASDRDDGTGSRWDLSDALGTPLSKVSQSEIFGYGSA